MNDLRHLVRIASIVLYGLSTLVVADVRFKCGFEVCYQNDFRVEAPLTGQDESPYCGGCDSKQDLCGTEKQQSGCKSFCEEYVTQKNPAHDCHESYNEEFHIGKGTFIVSLVVVCIVSIAVGAWLYHKYHTTRPWTQGLAETLRRILNVLESGEDKVERTVDLPGETSVKITHGEDQTTDSNVTVNTTLLHRPACRLNNINPTSPSQPAQFAPG